MTELELLTHIDLVVSSIYALLFLFLLLGICCILIWTILKIVL